MQQPCTRTTLIILTIVVFANSSHAEPILKPKKYHGPIPRRSFGLSIGFLAGADNMAMEDYQASLIPQPLQDDLVTQDFGNGPSLDAYYTVKMHPQFAFRGTGGATFLTSSSSGYTVATEPDTSGLLPLLQFERTFDVVLFSVSASGLYYFQDASVSEFQAYVGIGLIYFFPWEQYEESTVDTDTGLPYSHTETAELTGEPGAQGFIGALYHIRNNVAFFTEGRYQIGQSKFRMDLPTASDGVQNLSFDVHYTGFSLLVGASRFF